MIHNERKRKTGGRMGGREGERARGKSGRRVRGM